MTIQPEGEHFAVSLRTLASDLAFDSVCDSPFVREMTASIRAKTEHRMRVIAGRYRLGAILCVMSADPRLGPGKCERYALPVWRDYYGEEG